MCKLVRNLISGIGLRFNHQIVSPVLGTHDHVVLQQQIWYQKNDKREYIFFVEERYVLQNKILDSDYKRNNRKYFIFSNRKGRLGQLECPPSNTDFESDHDDLIKVAPLTLNRCLFLILEDYHYVLWSAI